jgi:hypothetical protein
MGVVHAVRAVLPSMIARRSGHLVAVASTLSLMGGCFGGDGGEAARGRAGRRGRGVDASRQGGCAPGARAGKLLKTPPPPPPPPQKRRDRLLRLLAQQVRGPGPHGEPAQRGAGWGQG